MRPPSKRHATIGSPAQVGEPITIGTGIALIASILSAAGISAATATAMASAIAVSLIGAGVVAGKEALQEALDGLTRPDSPEAKAYKNFDPVPYDKELTSEAKVLRLIERFKEKNGHQIGTLIGIKLMYRWKTVLEAAHRYVEWGIANDQHEALYWAGLTRKKFDPAWGKDAETVDLRRYHFDFFAEQWDREYVSDAAVFAFIRDRLQKPFGRRGGALCGFKVWARYQYLIHERGLVPLPSGPTTYATNALQTLTAAGNALTGGQLGVKTTYAKNPIQTLTAAGNALASGKVIAKTPTTPSDVVRLAKPAAASSLVVPLAGATALAAVGFGLFLFWKG